MPERSRPTRRELTADLLDRLLDRLSPTRSEAAEQYNRTRARLIQYFTWQRAEGPEDLADEVFNRVARRISEGENIPNLPGYFLGVARLVSLEARERKAREGRALEEYAQNTRHIESAGQDEQALECLDQCLAELTADRREQLLSYYTGDQATRIERRRELARRLDIGPVALRNRMLRMRQRLEACLEECLSGRSDRDGSSGPDTHSKRVRLKSSGGERA